MLCDLQTSSSSLAASSAHRPSSAAILGHASSTVGSPCLGHVPAHETRALLAIAHISTARSGRHPASQGGLQYPQAVSGGDPVGWLQAPTRWARWTTSWRSSPRSTCSASAAGTPRRGSASRRAISFSSARCGLAAPPVQAPLAQRSKLLHSATVRCFETHAQYLSNLQIQGPHSTVSHCKAQQQLSRPCG